MAALGASEFRAEGVDYTINDPNNANEFSASVAYSAGQYVYYQGILYRFTADHAAGAWNSAHVTQAKLGQDVSDLKSAIMRNIPADWLESGNIGSTGADASGNDRIRSCFMRINGSTTISCEGSAYSIVVYLYNDSFEYDDTIEPFAQKASFSYSGYARIKVKNNSTPSGNISSEINTVAQSVYISQTVTEGKWCLTTGGIVSGGVAASGVFTNHNDRARTMLLQVNGKSIFSLPNTSVYEMVAYSYYNDFSFHEQFVTSWSKEVRANFTGYVVLMFRNSTTPSGNISGEIETIRSSLKCNFEEFVYPVAKELDNLKKEYNTSKEEKFSFPFILPYGSLESGNINAEGKENDDASRIRSMFLPVNGSATFTIPWNSPYQMLAYSYDTDFNFIEQFVDSWTRDITASYNGYVRLKFRNQNTPSTSIKTEVEALRQVLSCKFTDFAFPTANRLYDFITNQDAEEINSQIIGKRICVSDTSLTCACGAEVAVDEAKGQVYVVYLSSRTNYGEQRDLVVLSKFSIANPNVAEHFIVAENNVAIGDVTVIRPYEPNIIKIGNTLQISFYSDGQYYIRDFDITTKQFSNSLTKMKVSYGGNAYDFNDTNIEAYYENNNATYGTYTIFSCRIVTHNNLYYATITSDSSGANSVLCTSSDGIVWNLQGLLPGTARYEEQLAYVDDVLYAIGREDNKIYCSSDDGTTWTEYMAAGPFYTRPQLISYKDNLLSLIPYNVNVDDYIGEFGRNTIGVFLNKVHKLTISSKYSIVYPAVFLINNDIYIVYANGEIFSGMYESTAKDALFLSKIGEIYEDEDYQYRV